MGQDDSWPDWNRRTVLKSVGVGATLPIFGGVAGATPAGCPDCPDGTRFLAKYEFDEDAAAFAFEEGACADPFTDVEWTNKEGEDAEPVEVSFTSPVVATDVLVKRGTECEFASASDDVALAVDDEKDEDGFEHTVSVPEDSRAISHFSACAGVCFQVDFVVGDVIEELGEGGIYGDRLIAVRWDSTTGDGGEVVNNGADGFETDDGDTITTADGVEFDDAETEGSVSFAVELASEDVTLTVASYAAVCPPDFDMDTAHLQDLVDYRTVTYTSDGEDSLTVDLAGLEWLDELCVD